MFVQKLMMGAAGFVLVLLLIGFALPRESRFVVAATIDAPAATVFVLVNDPRRIQFWSTLAGNDTEPHYSGPPNGKGATMAWDGPSSGSGTLAIVDSRPYSYVELKLNDGDAGEAVSWFELAAGPGRTDVRWGFAHDYGLNVIGRYVGLLATGILRRDYAERLERLEQLAESLPAADFSHLNIESARVDEVPLAVMTFTSATDAATLAAALGKAYFDIMQYVDRHRLQAAGPPRLILRDYVGASRLFDAGIPLGELPDPLPPDDRVRIVRSDAGPALKATHVGSYDRLGEVHRKMVAYLAAAGIERAGAPWESYVNDAADVPESALITEIYYPIAAD